MRFLILLPAIALYSCGKGKNKDSINPEHTKVATLLIHKDTLKESFQQEDTPGNEYLTATLKPIRENFKRINSIAKWTSTVRKELDDSNEGGEALFYYSGGVLEKIVTRQFGETFQQLTEYYLLKGQLSFEFEKSYTYNRPIYYDSTSMKENNDNQAFHFEKSEIEEDRSYFEKGKLIHQANNQDCGSPFANDYLLDEQKRIVAEFKRIYILNNIGNR